MRSVIHSVSVHGADADWILFDGGTVAESGHGDTWRTRAHDSAFDGEGGLLSPGFIDLHTHGGGGHEHESGTEAIVAARRAHLAHGTTSAVISLVSAPVEVLAERVAEIAGLVGTHGILGSHLEGPFLAPSRKGAHDEAALRDPTVGDLARLLEAGGVRQVTLAPELAGGLEAVRRIVDSGAVAAVGHTDADRSVAAEAFAAGASLVTHTFNAMPPLLHRAPGPIGAALSNEDVTLEVIADGVHVHADLIRVLFAAAPGRVVLVTDAMAAAGAADGEYRLGGLNVTVDAGVARLANGAIAGSTLTQDAALRQTVAAGVSVDDAIAALTTTPARVLGRDDLGILSPGAVADAVLLDADLHVRGVWAAGRQAP